MFETAVCDVLTADINYNGTLEFDLFNWGMTLGGCNEQISADFQAIYLDTFFVLNINNNFTYTISNESSYKVLSIINDSGDEAIYSSELLSTQDYSKNLFTIFRNPVKDELFISRTIDLNDVKINIFNINGKLVLSLNSFDANNKAINLQKLTSCTYFIQIRDNQGQIYTQKMIKV
jgi:hypothetical protein